jgi:NAD-dependent dihydropyrimidine dehydrogenase PreA subunit
MGKMYIGIPREKIPWRPFVDAEKCIGCGDCLETCSNGVFVLNEETHTVEVAEANNCVVLCDKCAGFCNQDAITFPDKDEIKALIAKILQHVPDAGCIRTRIGTSWRIEFRMPGTSRRSWLVILPDSQHPGGAFL